MLKRINAIKNVGRFRHSTAAGNTTLAKHTFIAGANGFGKSTICAVLRSLKTGDGNHIVGRKTLGTSDELGIELLLTGGVARFDGASWDKSHSDIAIFDNVFIAENVHSGEVVEIDHKRNLYRIIVGDLGVKLAAEDTRLSNASRSKTTEITAAAKAIQPHLPVGMTLDAFLALPVATNVNSAIAAQVAIVDAVQQAASIKEKSILAELNLPAVPDSFLALLSHTIDDIADDAEAVVRMHMETHGISADQSGWISQGVSYALEHSCPFCGQDIEGLSLIAAFKTVFSARYKSLSADIAAMKTTVEKLFGDIAMAHYETLTEQNKNGIDFWSRYCTFDAASVRYPDEISEVTSKLAQACLDLLGKKTIAPLDAIIASQNFDAAVGLYNTIAATVKTVNEAIQDANKKIVAKKTETADADIVTAKAKLSQLKLQQTRHGPAVSALCDDYFALSKEKDEIEAQKPMVRKQLNEYTASVVKPYEISINRHLDNFNAGFTIDETKHGYPGGIATSTYQLVINDTSVEIGDGKTPDHIPSFKNTLSAGDRSTLALAFFLAHLEQDTALDNKIVVFDDPFNSQDAFRRRQTINEIMKVAEDCLQVIILSHDATFLKQIWEKCPASQRAAVTIADHRKRGSKIVPFDLEQACQGRTASDLDDLQTYMSHGTGKDIDIIRKMRVVLEAYSQTTYPTSFAAGDWLGDIIRKIREGGPGHPAADHYDELNQINDYTSQYHHGPDVQDVTPDTIDPIELTGYTKRTLKIVNALQA